MQDDVDDRETMLASSTVAGGDHGAPRTGTANEDRWDDRQYEDDRGEQDDGASDDGAYEAHWDRQYRGEGDGAVNDEWHLTYQDLKGLLAHYVGASTPAGVASTSSAAKEPKSRVLVDVGCGRSDSAFRIGCDFGFSDLYLLDVSRSLIAELEAKYSSPEPDRGVGGGAASAAAPVTGGSGHSPTTGRRARGEEDTRSLRLPPRVHPRVADCLSLDLPTLTSPRAPACGRLTLTPEKRRCGADVQARVRYAGHPHLPAALVLDKGTLDAMAGERDQVRLFEQCLRLMRRTTSTQADCCGERPGGEQAEDVLQDEVHPDSLFVTISFPAVGRIRLLRKLCARHSVEPHFHFVGSGDPARGGLCALSHRDRKKFALCGCGVCAGRAHEKNHAARGARQLDPGGGFRRRGGAGHGAVVWGRGRRGGCWGHGAVAGGADSYRVGGFLFQMSSRGRSGAYAWS